MGRAVSVKKSSVINGQGLCRKMLPGPCWKACNIIASKICPLRLTWESPEVPPGKLPCPIVTCVVPCESSRLTQRELLGLQMAAPRHMGSILGKAAPLTEES